MLVCVAQIVQKRDRQGRHRLPRWQSCQRRLPPRTAGRTASCHARLERSQGDTLVDVLERGYRVVAFRGKRLAASVVLSRPEACRSPGLAGTRGASRQVPCDALVGLPGKLLLPGPCLLGLNTLFLNGSKGTTEDLGGHPASLAAGCCNCPCTSSGY